ncbi:hypothetical protein [Nocardia vaccinii]|uniref:hypothetical protein n=1 Tax=Nocardia vaccinii TaxID=1822 RepID=UPI00082C4611|nr:hypothetical protein [Nocardia vaccinii]
MALLVDCSSRLGLSLLVVGDLVLGTGGDILDPAFEVGDVFVTSLLHEPYGVPRVDVVPHCGSDDLFPFTLCGATIHGSAA